MGSGNLRIRNACIVLQTYYKSLHCAHNLLIVLQPATTINLIQRNVDLPLPLTCAETQSICRLHSHEYILCAWYSGSSHRIVKYKLHLCEIGRRWGVSHFRRKGKVFLETTLISTQQLCCSLLPHLKLDHTRMLLREKFKQTNKIVLH